MSDRIVRRTGILSILAVVAIVSLVGVVSVGLVRQERNPLKVAVAFSYPEGPESPSELLTMADALVLARPEGGEEMVLQEDGNGLRLLGTGFQVTQVLKGDLSPGSSILVTRTDLAGASTPEEGPFAYPMYLLALRAVDPAEGVWAPIAGSSGRIAFAPGPEGGPPSAVPEDASNAIQQALAGKTLPDVIAAIAGNG